MATAGWRQRAQGRRELHGPVPGGAVYREQIKCLYDELRDIDRWETDHAIVARRALESLTKLTQILIHAAEMARH